MISGPSTRDLKLKFKSCLSDWWTNSANARLKASEVSLDEKAKKEKEERDRKEAAAQLPTNTSGGGAQGQGSRSRQLVLPLNMGVPEFSVGTSGYMRDVGGHWRIHGAAAAEKFFDRKIRAGWWNSKGDPKLQGNKFYIIVEPWKAEDMEDFSTVRELLGAHSILQSWVRRASAMLHNPTTVQEYLAKAAKDNLIKYPTDAEVNKFVLGFWNKREQAAKLAKEEAMKKMQRSAEQQK